MMPAMLPSNQWLAMGREVGRGGMRMNDEIRNPNDED
jgi:hypothetical protein